jgi:GNAT superfamily N-acetyltransferase
MKDRKLRIQRLSRSHVMTVSQLHVMGLSRHFSGWAGRQIISLFYRELIATHDPPPGFVATVDGRVVGFAIAVADASAIKRRVVKKWFWRLTILGTVQIVTSPMRFIGWLRGQLAVRTRRLGPGGADPLDACCPAPRIEFRGIVVDPTAHVPGAALALMQARLKWAKAAGYKSIFFRIDKDNEHSVKLCQWAGAKPVPNDEHYPRLRFYKVLA